MQKLAAIAFLLCSIAVSHAATVEAMARAYRKAPTAANRAALTAHAAQHPRDTEGAIAWLAVAGADLEGGRYADALKALEAIGPARLAKIQDHIAYLTVNALYGAGSDMAAVDAVAPVLQSRPKSPLISRTVIAAAKAGLRSGQAARVLQLLRAHYNELAQPQADALVAEALEKTGDLVAAANYQQRIWQNYPQSKEASDAEAAMSRLQSQLGSTYPPPMPAAILQRASRLIVANQYTTAKRDLESALPSFTGASRDIAAVRIAVCSQSDAELQALNVSDPEANAERLAAIAALAARTNRESDMMDAVTQLQKYHAASTYRLDALLTAGQFYFQRSRTEDYYGVYQQCSMGFPRDPKAAMCHWRAALSEHLRGRPKAAEMFQHHVRFFPGDEHTPAALYYLGRLAEAAKDPGAARVYYAEIESSYPNFYYTMLAREQLRTVGNAAPSLAARQFLQSIQWPDRKRIEDFTPTPATNLRLERARLLQSAALDFQADQELRFGGRNDAQGHILAIELAANATRRGLPDQAMRWIKALVPQYLMMPIDSAPREFWRYAYPLPWRKQIEDYARQSEVDPFLLAGLIRQESEFDPKVVSYANAHGLSQIMPPTGRELARRLRIPGYSNSLLFNPDINIRMGAFHLRNMFNYFNQKMEHTIASYNAGMGRVGGWLKATPASSFREPAEWVETIPIDQTRGYVQSVLRNADFYRRLYADSPDEFTPVSYTPPVVKTVAPAAKKKAAAKPVKRRTTPAKKKR
ncbi:hypothetical protein F183_A51960 [Bryobacterales bacterium F-183]|nr:hypothetical protein F183_A51960 [Bryobacterales bacterium F-183]